MSALQDFANLLKIILALVAVGLLIATAYDVYDSLRTTVWICPGGVLYKTLPLNGQWCRSHWTGWAIPSLEWSLDWNVLSLPPTRVDPTSTMPGGALILLAAMVLVFATWVEDRIQWLDTLTKRGPLVLMRTSYGSIEESIKDSERIFKEMVGDMQLKIAQSLPGLIDFGSSAHLTEAAKTHHAYYVEQTNAFFARRRVARILVESALYVIGRHPDFHTAWDAAVEALDSHLKNPGSMPRMPALPRLLGLPWDVTSDKFAGEFLAAKERGINLWVKISVVLPLWVALRMRDWPSAVQIRVRSQAPDTSGRIYPKKPADVQLLKGDDALEVLSNYIATPPARG